MAGSRETVLTGGLELLLAEAASLQDAASMAKICACGFHVSAFGPEAISSGAQDANAFAEGFQTSEPAVRPKPRTCSPEDCRPRPNPLPAPRRLPAHPTPSRTAETSRVRRILVGGAETVSAGGSGSGAIVGGLSAVQCVQGGHALSAAVSACGRRVLFGADVRSTFAGSAGEVLLSKGVAATSVYVSEGGSAIISSGAKDTAATVEGRQIVEVGGSAVQANVSGSVARQGRAQQRLGAPAGRPRLRLGDDSLRRRPAASLGRRPGPEHGHPLGW